MKTLHVLGLANTLPTPEFSSCAYTQKTRRFVEMMKSVGYNVEAYWGEPTNDPPACDISSKQWVAYNVRVSGEIKEKKKPGDFLCCSYGTCHEPIAKAHPDLIAVEHGIGYGGTFAKYRCFESYAWMHAVYGAVAKDPHAADGHPLDTVIPNSYSPDEFPEGPGGDYICFVGRLIARKGLKTVADVAKATGLPVKVAGTGPDAGILAIPGVQFMGSLTTAQVAELMGGARCTLVPTVYVEPFGGVAVESMMCGTPVVTTDWGAFTETVENGVTGYRARDSAEFVAAVIGCDTLDREKI